jgi:alkylhydroperoxidase family enzyme
VNDRLRAALAFIEKQTLRPDDLRPEDAEAAYAAGVSRQALRDAAQVSALFNMIVRLADAFGWEVPDWDRLLQRAPAMLEGGYAIGAVEQRAAT